MEQLFECDICGHIGPYIDFIYKLPEGQYTCVICAKIG